VESLVRREAQMQNWKLNASAMLAKSVTKQTYLQAYAAWLIRACILGFKAPALIKENGCNESIDFDETGVD